MGGVYGYDHCLNWTSVSHGIAVPTGGIGYTAFTDSRWTGGFIDGCNRKLAIYCFEQPTSSSPSPISTSTPTPVVNFCTVCSADINRDNIVNARDSSRITGCLNKPAIQCPDADTNKDGIIDIKDMNCVTFNYLKQCLQNISPTPFLRPTSTPTPKPIIAPSVSPSPLLLPSKTLKLYASFSETPKAFGEVTVDVLSYDKTIDFGRFRLKGKLGALIANRTYQVLLCLKDGASCSTSTSPAIITDKSGNATFTNIVFGMYNRSLSNDITYMKVVEIPSINPIPANSCYLTSRPCLQGVYGVPIY